LLKKLAKSFVPNNYLVPLKYYYNFITGKLEDELFILEYLLKRGDTAIDVGANLGVYSYKLYKIGTRLEIFEPNPTCLEILSTWVNNKKNINLHSIALSNKDGNALLNIPIDKNGVEHDASASITIQNFLNKRTHEILIKSLDFFNFSEISFIKIDVEGHEKQVLEGAENTLKKFKPSLLIEIEQRHSIEPIQNVFNFLEGLGYYGYFFNNKIIHSLSNFKIELHQNINNFENFNKSKYINNFIFLHKDFIEDGKYTNLFLKFQK
jgi:FkbM family methyltransferase